MQFRAQWRIPAMHGEKVFDGPLFPTWEQANFDVTDVTYPGIIAWVSISLEPNETPPSTSIDERTASYWRQSEWWKNLPVHVVALAQAKQVRLCMPFEDFETACTTVLKTPMPSSVDRTKLVELLLRQM